ncbi:hypothetical protein AAY24_03150 [Sedimenticola thiotaurini]|uniref:Uncharacterized protein n=1 Tax=Sedimenticola thiotaurini TaxID=1543721 RepID=A0A0F7JVU8_9GAMM|nr:hypothetical protein AAY24_03150 [Sedimenticola thiotaurini]
MIRGAASHQRPEDTGIFIRQSNTNPIKAAACNEFPQPAASRIISIPTITEHRSGSANQECAQIGIAPFTDTEESGLAATGVLSRNQSDPGGELSAIAERACITDGGNYGGSCHRPNTIYACQSFTQRIVLKNPADALIVLTDSPIQITQLFNLVGNKFSGQHGEIIPGLLKGIAYAGVEGSVAQGEGDAVLTQQSTGLVDQGSTNSNKPFSDAMNGLYVLLLNRLSGHKTHVRPSNRFTDGLGIVVVVLVCFYVRLYMLGTHLAELMAKRFELTRPIAGTTTGLYTNSTAWQSREERTKLFAVQSLFQDSMAMLIYSMHLKYILGEIDDDSLNIHKGPSSQIARKCLLNGGSIYTHFEEGWVHSIC